MTRFELWKDWYKHCTNSPIYKILVLLRLANSPTFRNYESIKRKFDENPGLTLDTLTDYKKQNKSEWKIYNWGWVLVYFLMLVINGLMNRAKGFDPSTWQYWVFSSLLMMCFVSGAYTYWKRGD